MLKATLVCKGWGFQHLICSPCDIVSAERINIMIYQRVVYSVVIPLTLYLGWIYIRVQVQETWMLKHPLMDLIFGLKIGPKLEVCFLKLGGVFS